MSKVENTTFGVCEEFEDLSHKFVYLPQYKSIRQLIYIDNLVCEGEDQFAITNELDTCYDHFMHDASIIYEVKE